MKKALVLMAVVCWAGMAGGDVVPNIQYDGWRGWNNHDAGASWMDSWGNHDDWGSATMCDAAVAQFDRTAIQTAINNVGGGAYDAYLHISVDLSYAANMGIARPVAGVFAIDNFPWGSATCQGTDFENKVTNNANGNNMHDTTFPWTYDTLANKYMLNLHVGSAMVDFYLNHPTADGFFISNANPNGSDLAERIAPPWGDGQPTFTLEIVPEPATMMLIGLGGLGLLLRKRR